MDVFCEALKSDSAWNGGNYADYMPVKQALNVLAHVYALMGLSTEFYKHEQWKRLGSMQAMLRGF